jgi:hemin uptake protein HemP
MKAVPLPADLEPIPPVEPKHPIVQSCDLFGTEREVVIVHGKETYRLRITRADKLILTK